MGQAEILKLVEKYPDKWFFTGDLQKILKNGRSNITSSMGKMEQQGYLEIESVKNLKGYWEFKCKFKKLK